MALTKTQISQLYVSLFGRASEGEGNTYWQTDENSTDMIITAGIMLATEAAGTYFGSTLSNNQAFIEHIYLNTLGKTYDEDPEGVDYWVGELGGKLKGEVVAALIAAAQHPDNAGAAQDQFNNRVEISDYSADNLFEYTDFGTFSGFISGVDDSDATVSSALAQIDEMSYSSPKILPHEDVTLPSNLSLDWVDNTEITLAPHKAIGQIIVTIGGISYIGTGFLISPEHVLTNAHVLLDEFGNLDSSLEFSFTPGLNGETGSATSYDWEQAWVEEYFDDSLYPRWPDNDLAVIKLDRPLENTIGYLKLEPDTNPDLAGVSLLSAGYPAGNMEQDNPATPGQDYYQWEVSGTVDQYIYDNGGLKLSSGMNVTGGASGSPVYYSQDNDTYFTGVIAGVLGDTTVAAAMDEDSYNWILGIVQQDGYYTDYTLA